MIPSTRLRASSILACYVFRLIFAMREAATSAGVLRKKENRRSWDVHLNCCN
jgi:hypothetical protein